MDPKKPLDPSFEESMSVWSGKASGSQDSEADPSIKILLAEIPAPRRVQAVSPEPEPVAQLLIPSQVPEEVPRRPSRLDPIKALVKQGYFDPAKAFEMEVDWVKFRKAQIFLFILSLAIPFLMLLLLGLLLGIVYLTGASLYAATAPNPVYELMLYPIVYVLARGYWIAYLALPIGLFAIGWLWATATAWAISGGTQGTHIHFAKAVAILAMLGAMLAPFTMFPFLRILALAVILWILAKRMEDTFDIGFWRLVGRGGLILLGATFLYGSFERKVESFFPSNEELKTNLEGFVKQRKKLEWPSFEAKVYINPNERILADLSAFTSQIRDQATQKAMAILKNGAETPDLRYRFAKKLADNGQTEAFLYMARYTAAGLGTSPDPAVALQWMQKFLDANPNNLEAGLEKAKLLLLTDRRLDAKMWLVQQAKNQMKEFSKIASFIQKENLGHIDPSLNMEVLNLYQNGNSSTYSGSSLAYSPASGSKYVYEYQTKQDLLLKKLYVNEHDGSLWFYRALVVEYARSAQAGPEIYGEVATAYRANDLEQKIKEGDPVALDIAADRSLQKGDVDTARQYWVAATKALNNDDRHTNVPYYLKLAESYDPDDTSKDPNPREATKYYLATLLISTSNSHMTPIGLSSLQRLNRGVIPDPTGRSFLELCLKYDVPEAWVVMGDRHLNGDYPGIPRNIAKAKDCFLKAQSLGYKGPQFFKQLALLDSPNSVTWNSLAGGR